MNIENFSKEIINDHTAIFIVVDATDDENNKSIVLEHLKDDGWISSFSDALKKSYSERIKSTVDAFLSKSSLCDDNKNSVLDGLVGEKIVTVFSCKTIEKQLGYFALPLGDSFKEQTLNNPGYDYFNEDKLDFFIVFGEGKYKSDSNPYSDALKQIVEFESINKSLKELGSLNGIVDSKSIDNYEDKHMFSAGFSYRKTERLGFKDLVMHIKESEYFKKVISFSDVIVVGVRFNGV